MTCRKLSGGSNTVNLLIPETHFRICAGTAKQYETLHESGMNLTLVFCGTCSTPLYKVGSRKELEGKIILFAGTLDESDGLNLAKPAEELYTKHRAKWLPVIEEVQQSAEFSEHLSQST